MGGQWLPQFIFLPFIFYKMVTYPQNRSCTHNGWWFPPQKIVWRLPYFLVGWWHIVYLIVWWLACVDYRVGITITKWFPLVKIWLISGGLGHKIGGKWSLGSFDSRVHPGGFDLFVAGTSRLLSSGCSECRGRRRSGLWSLTSEKSQETEMEKAI